MDTLRSNFKAILLVLGAIAVVYFFLRRPSETITVSAPPGAAGAAATEERTYEIITLLPRDAIPAIDRPRFNDIAAADQEYAPDELVLGVAINGDSRAYSTSYLDSHEIVNDTVGGRKIAVTW